MFSVFRNFSGMVRRRYSVSVRGFLEMEVGYSSSLAVEDGLFYKWVDRIVFAGELVIRVVCVF